MLVHPNASFSFCWHTFIEILISIVKTDATFFFSASVNFFMLEIVPYTNDIASDICIVSAALKFLLVVYTRIIIVILTTRVIMVPCNSNKFLPQATIFVV